MRAYVLCILLFIVSCFVFSSCKVYTRCSLSQELVRQKFARTFISNWVCLIENESGRNTSKIKERANGSKNYGLFQINSREWCTPGRKGGKCIMRCEDLTDEDISDDVVCAKKVFNERGFQAWEGWARGCYGRQLNSYDVSRC